MEYNKELIEGRNSYQKELKNLNAEQIASIIEQAVLLGLPGILPNSQILEAKIRKDAVEMVREKCTIKEIKEYILTNSKKLKF